MNPIWRKILGCLVLAAGVAILLHSVASVAVPKPAQALPASAPSPMPTPTPDPLGVQSTGPVKVQTYWYRDGTKGSEIQTGPYQFLTRDKKIFVINFCPTVPAFEVGEKLEIFYRKDKSDSTCSSFIRARVLEDKEWTAP